MENDHGQTNDHTLQRVKPKLCGYELIECKSKWITQNCIKIWLFSLCNIEQLFKSCVYFFMLKDILARWSGIWNYSEESDISWQK